MTAQQPRMTSEQESRQVAEESRETVLAEIFDVARSNNKKAGVTGALLVTDHWFVQALEGDEATVTTLYQRISGDDRHDKVPSHVRQRAIDVDE